MLIGKNIRRISHNLIISKYFEEENNEIQNQYFIRNVADELSVISLGLGGFFVVINPCSFDIEYSSDTFGEMNEINLKEVEKFEAKAATVFRIEDQTNMPKFNFEYIRSTLDDEAKLELDQAIANNTGINDQYSIEQGSLGTNFDTIELNMEALNAANYEHVDNKEYNKIASSDVADELALEIANRKQELEILNQQLANRSEELVVETKPEAAKAEAVEIADFDELSNELDALNDFLDPDDLFAKLDELVFDVAPGEEKSESVDEEK